MPGTNFFFSTHVEPVSSPWTPRDRGQQRGGGGKWWRRRALPPGPLRLFHKRFSAIAVLPRQDQYKRGAVKSKLPPHNLLETRHFWANVSVRSASRGLPFSALAESRYNRPMQQY